MLGSIAGILTNTDVALPAILLGRAIDIALASSRGQAGLNAVTCASLLFIAGTLATEAPRLFKRWFLITANGRMRANLRADLLRGLFATRHPCRPNPIGLSIVRLLARRENVLEIEGVDMLDGTPLLDVKPYVPDFDAPTATRTGWYETRSKK